MSITSHTDVFFFNVFVVGGEFRVLLLCHFDLSSQQECYNRELPKLHYIKYTQWLQDTYHFSNHQMWIMVMLELRKYNIFMWLGSVQFSHSVVCDSLWPHGLQHARPPCPSPAPGVYPNSCPLSRWCHPTISSSVVPFSSCLQSFPASVFSNESALRLRWPKYWSFSLNISPFSKYSGLISFRMDWDSQESSPTLQFKSINSLAFSLPYGPTLTSIHD